ncbi:MAG: hypothetical protein A2934_02810 [Candidatus Sungbacteria bacterium RIFCSPLOWO2_01_FULL_47_10]|uniref:Type II secretion system protein GspF domain-containing protein n=1 Tax=Candidatus Sungbacteria bacterium RIFCSPLOWO2_01_FULL_47_10 TaxID=1802276 RepID=A0A1G2L0W3_9BACT|nr:MAG: hypothetical protein A2934_02810 [Candidatus Sungbacteria bacterium RIFCSPLOWO2_01_FULL_47_10]
MIMFKTMKTETKNRRSGIWGADVSFGRVNITQKTLFARHMSVMLKAGVPIVESLQVAVESADGKFKRVLAGVLRAVESGNPLSAALRLYASVFPPFFINAAYAGEKSGTLVENLENISVELEKEKALLGKVRGALTYPIIVIVLAFFLVMAFSFFVLPKIAPLFSGLGQTLPLSTRVMISFSRFMEQWGVYAFFLLIGCIPFLVWFLRRPFVRPVTHRLLLIVPVVRSISHNVNLVRFSRTLAMLVRSGISIDEALSIVEETLGNFYYRRAIRRVTEHVRRGGKLSEALELRRDLFPVLLTRMVRVGEESGKFEETLFYLGTFYEDEVDAATRSITTIIEPALLLGIGLVVGFIALSIITPIYNITGNISR